MPGGFWSTNEGHFARFFDELGDAVDTGLGHAGKAAKRGWGAAFGQPKRHNADGDPLEERVEALEERAAFGSDEAPQTGSAWFSGPARTAPPSPYESGRYTEQGRDLANSSWWQGIGEDDSAHRYDDEGWSFF